jgi:hypothetical protein
MRRSTGGRVVVTDDGPRDRRGNRGRAGLIGGRIAMCAAVAALGLLPAAPEVRAQAAPPPFTFTANRTVAPLDVMTGDTVHVQITAQGQTTSVSKGLDVFFLVDRSLTMFDRASNRPEGKAFMDFTKEQLRTFVNAMDFSKCKAGVISYAADSQVNRPLTADQDAILNTIAQIRLSQETDVRGLQGAFRTATEKLQDDGDPDNRKFILVVNAGADTGQDLINMPTITQAARNAGVDVLFLMWTSQVVDSAYAPFVQASSDCSWARCPLWNIGSAGERRYAWRISVSGNYGGEKVDTLVRDLIQHFLVGPTIAAVEVSEGYDPRVDFIPMTPPTQPTGPPYYVVLWRMAGIGPAGITIDYEARMLEPGTYPVAADTTVRVIDSDGTAWGPYPLPNPAVTVRDPGAVTPTVTPTPDVTAPPPTTLVPPTVTATRTPIATVPTPTATSGETRFDIFLPALLRKAAW